MSQSTQRIIPDERRLAGRDPWFDRPFDRLTVLSEAEGLTVLSKVERLTVPSKVEGLTTLSKVEEESSESSI